MKKQTLWAVVGVGVLVVVMIAVAVVKMKGLYQGSVGSIVPTSTTSGPPARIRLDGMVLNYNLTESGYCKEEIKHYDWIEIQSTLHPPRDVTVFTCDYIDEDGEHHAVHFSGSFTSQPYL